jgi:glycosyltransferase involved in cell wall biosynthesis
VRVFTLAANEDWICDRFAREWRRHSSEFATAVPHDADVIWLLAGWCWRHIDSQLLATKKVVATIHHIDESKFDKTSLDDFKARDEFVDMYHVPCRSTWQLVSRLTKKPIFVQQFWVNQKLWFPLNKDDTREKLGLNDSRFLIGSFQRDTEGSDLVSPKLAKGPDVFVDVVSEFNKHRKFDVEVILAGWRRQYVMRRLDELGIKYMYFDRPSDNFLNMLYNALDLYVVGSRCEGGPQAVVECAATQTPILSTPVGIAEDILGKLDESPNIFTISPDGRYPKLTDRMKHINTLPVFNNVMNNFLMNGMDPFVRLFERLVKHA